MLDDPNILSNILSSRLESIGIFSLSSLLANLAVGYALSILVRWHFLRFGSALSNRYEFGMIIPFLLLTTILVINVVKSSLALSLGLVGALSIVRFRTPIKEPEELVYLFFAIGIGLGLGANQTLATIVATLSILSLVTILRYSRQYKQEKHLFLTIAWDNSDANSNDNKQLEIINSLVASNSVNSNLQRLHSDGASFEATYLLDIASSNNLEAMISILKKNYPSSRITFIDQKSIPNF